MRVLRKSLIIVRPVAWLAVIALLNACTGWTSKNLSPEEMLAEKAPEESVRLILRDGTDLRFMQPYLVGDSLAARTGMYESKVEIPGPAGTRATKTDKSLTADEGSLFTVHEDYLAVAMSDVERLEVLRTDAGKTVLLVMVIAATGVIIAGAIALSQWDGIGGPSSSSGSGSCPHLYCWDGSSWRLDSGTFAGAYLAPLARSDVDNLIHPSDQSGLIQTLLINETEEIDYVDALELLAVDHAPNLTVAPDADGNIHSLREMRSPISADDYRGVDVLARVSELDEWYWESRFSGRDPALDSDIRDGIEIEFPRPAAVTSAKLVVDGKTSLWLSYLTREFISAHGADVETWYAQMNGDTARARFMGRRQFEEVALTVKIWTEDGWSTQGHLRTTGPEVGKRQVQLLDLTRARGQTVRVRLESVPSYWLLDKVAIDYSLPAQVAVSAIQAETAIDWEGRDVRSVLSQIDGEILVLEIGQSANVSFRVPPVPPGKERSYLARTTGWYKILPAPGSQADPAGLARLQAEPLAVSRLSVERANDLLGTLPQSQETPSR